MARQRFIHPDLWSDPTLGQLTPIERLFFIGCFSNADDEGRLLGNPAYLRATIFPYDDLSLDEVKAMRDRVVTLCKNLVLYEVDGLEYLAFLKWNKYQKPKYPKPSKLPPPPCKEFGESFPQNSGNHEETLEEDFRPRLGLGRDGFGMGLDRDGMGAPSQGSDALPPPSLPDHTETEREILKELKDVLNYPFDFSQDLDFARTLMIEFPTLDLLTEVKKWRTYKRDKPLKPKSNARLQLRNWCEKAVQWQKEREVNNNGTPRADPKPPAAEKPRSRYPTVRVIDGKEYFG